MRGGRVIFLVDVIQLDEQAGLRARPVTSGLEDQLASYGVRVQKGLVRDSRYNTHASFSTGFMQYSVPYPFWPKISGPFLARDVAPTSRLESLVLPWPAPLKLDVPLAGEDPLLNALSDEDKDRAEELDGSDVVSAAPSEDPAGEMETADGAPEDAGGEEAETADLTPSEEPGPAAPVVAHILARTSPFSELRMGNYDLAPETNPFRSMSAKLGKSYVVVASLEGRFRSHFADRVVPSADGGEAEPDTTAEAGKLLESQDTQILVMGNSFFLQDNFIVQFPENLLYFQNVVDWLTLGPELIGIRSRGATDRPLKELSDGAKTVIKTVVTLGPALIVVVIGFLRMVSRRRRRAAVEEALRTAIGQRG
jgi:ABC-type uncharacterized transport system involved in gliding motility auxiliary subunit